MDPDLRLYEVAAQVIPILFLALLIERRYFDLADDEPERLSLRFHLLAIAALSFAGEWVAIQALALGREPTEFARQILLLSMGVSFLALVAGAAQPQLQALARRWPVLGRWGNLLWLFSILAVWVLAVVGADVGMVLSIAAFAILVTGGFISDWEPYLERKRRLREEAGPDSERERRGDRSR